MRCLHVALVDHGIMHSRIYSCMAEQFLHLLDWHALVDGMCGKCAAEFVRMDSVDTGFFAKLLESSLDASDGDTSPLTAKGYEQCRIVVIA